MLTIDSCAMCSSRFPVAFRRTPYVPAPPPRLPFCSTSEWGALANGTNVETMPSYCPLFFPQPVKASFFSDMSQFGSLFTKTGGPATLDPVETQFYGFTPHETFDPRGQWLSGAPFYTPIPTHNIEDLYPFLDDAPNAQSEINLLYNKVTDDPPFTGVDDFITSAQCSGGACFSAFSNLTHPPSSPDASLARSLLNIFPMTNHGLFTSSLWKGVAPFTNSIANSGHQACIKDNFKPCTTVTGYLFNTSDQDDLLAFDGNPFATVHNAGECCHHCNITARCVYFSFESSTTICRLMTQNSAPEPITVTNNPLDVSGVITFRLDTTLATPPATFSDTDCTTATALHAFPGSDFITRLPGVSLPATCADIDTIAQTCTLHYGPVMSSAETRPDHSYYIMKTIPQKKSRTAIEYASGNSLGTTPGTSFDTGVVLGLFGPPPVSETVNLQPPVDTATFQPPPNIYTLLESIFLTREKYHTLTSGVRACNTSQPYCRFCTSQTIPNPFAPPWAWSSDCSASSASTTLFNRDNTTTSFATSLEQSLSNEFSVTSKLVFATAANDNLEWWHPLSIPSAVGTEGHTYCWVSSRGIVGDDQEAIGGVAVSLDSKCTWQRIELRSNTHTRHTTTLYHHALDDIPGDSVLVVNDTSGDKSRIDWTHFTTNSASNVECKLSNSSDNLVVTRTCTFDASSHSQHPPMLSSMTIFQHATATHQPTSARHNVSHQQMIANLCGCPSNFVAPSTGIICRFRFGGCFVPTSFTDCSSVGYVCGSTTNLPIGQVNPSAQKLCVGCPSDQVGQCARLIDGKIDECTSYDDDGTCKSQSHFCADLGLPTYLPGIFAAASLNNEPNSTTFVSLWESESPTYPMISHDVGFWWQTPQFSRSMWQVGLPHETETLDTSLCQPLGVDNKVLERPSLLHPTDSILEISNLTSWCREADNSPTLCTYRQATNGTLPSRARLCTYNQETNKCSFRVDASTGTPTPQCFTWVPDVDPHYECGGSRFTGCVVSSTFYGSSAILSDEPSTHGVVFNYPQSSLTVSRGFKTTSLSRIEAYDVPSIVIDSVFTDPDSSNTITLPPSSYVGYWSTTPDEGDIQVKQHPLGGHTGTRIGATTQYKVDFESPLRVLSLPVTTSVGVQFDFDNATFVLGLRMTIVGLPPSTRFFGAADIVDSDISVIPSSHQLARLLTTCVPLTVKKALTSATMG